jgi:hypothetical protein
MTSKRAIIYRRIDIKLLSPQATSSNFDSSGLSAVLLERYRSQSSMNLGALLSRKRPPPNEERISGLLSTRLAIGIEGMLRDFLPLPPLNLKSILVCFEL